MKYGKKFYDRHVTLIPPVVKIRRFYITKTCQFKHSENFTTQKENFQIKSSDMLHISAQNIDCGYALEPSRRDGSNAYLQSMFWSRNKKNNVNPSFSIHV